MIRSHLLKLSKLSRAFNLKDESRRCLQRSTVCYKNYYVERNDDLLDIDEILKTKSETRVYDNGEANQDEFRRKTPFKSDSTKSFKSLKRSKIESKKSNRNSKEYMEAFFKTDPLVRQQFVEDCSLQDYPNHLIIEGKNLINDVISYDYPKLIRIYYSDDKKLEKLNQLDKLKQDGVEFMKVDMGIMKEHSDVVTPQGLIGVVRLRTDELFRLNSNKIKKELPLIVVTLGLSEPGNMGALVRSSLACGVEKLLCIKKCAQLLKSKVIRSSAGSVFQMPFIENIDIQDLKSYLPENCTFYAADSNLNLSDYILTGQEKKDDSNEGSSPHAFLDSLPALNYTDIDYFSKSDNCICLIVCGESGLNSEARKLIHESNCTRINIPMTNNVDSLNTSVAASLVMYEIRRQFKNKLS